jgi:hypothetical protein
MPYRARSAATVLTVALAIACGPPRLGADTSGDGSTSEQSTDSSTSNGGESSSTETGEPTTDTSETELFLPQPDMPPFHCNQWTQDCPEGEKCVPYSSTGGPWDDHKCVPVLGEQAPGEPCFYDGVEAATDDCDETSFCWDVMDVDGQMIGICRQFCLGNADDYECPPGSVCLHYDINACIPYCDPIQQDCGEGLACYWANSEFFCIFTTQNIPVGQPCGFINDCAEGLGCLTAEVLPGCEGSACCSGFCDLNLGDAPCEALLPGTVCSSFFEEGTAPPQYAHVGVCILPP